MRSRLAVFCLVVLTTSAAAADWPQWRGPDRTDRSPEKGLLKSWPEGGPKLVSTYERAGVGYSGFAVVGDHLYTMGDDGEHENVFALDLKNFKKRWEQPVDAHFENSFGGGPRATPTVVGDLLYTMGGSGGLACVDRKREGKLVWLVDLRKDLGGQLKKYALLWGYSESPLVDGDRVIVTPGGPRGSLAALDRQTGKVLWRSKEWTSDADYTSVVPATIHGVRQYVALLSDSVGGVRASDGKLLWKFPRPAKISISTPIVTGDLVYVSSAYNYGCNLLRIKKEGDTFSAEDLYDDEARKVMQNHHGGVILYKGHLYGYSESGGWTCQELKTGKRVWASKKLDKGSLTYADGHFILFGEKSGNCVLIEATPKGWVEKGRFPLPRESQKPRPTMRRGANFWTHPVVANGHLYLRDQEFIFRFDIRAEK